MSNLARQRKRSGRNGCNDPGWQAPEHAPHPNPKALRQRRTKPWFAAPATVKERQGQLPARVQRERVMRPQEDREPTLPTASVPERGVEPPPTYVDMNLNHARLPIPPLGQSPRYSAPTSNSSMPHETKKAVRCQTPNGLAFCFRSTYLIWLKSAASAPARVMIA